MARPEGSGGGELPEPGEQAVDVLVVVGGRQADAQPAGVAQAEVPRRLDRVEVAGRRVDPARGEEPVGVGGVAPGEGQEQSGGPALAPPPDVDSRPLTDAVLDPLAEP